jgi:ubiquitin carboxyl-terminal hydrolase 7
MIEPMKAKQSLKAAELQDGDIVCFQLAVSDHKSDSDRESVSNLTQRLTLTDLDNSSIKSTTKSILGSTVTGGSTNSFQSSIKTNLEHIDDARNFYDFLLHKRVVRFTPHPTRSANPDQYEPFQLVLSSKHSYDQLAAKVGEALNVDPTHIRFWTVNATNGNPKASVKRGQSQNLQTILNPPYSTFSNNNQRADALFFEVLEISLSELDTKKNTRVIWLSEGMSKEVCYSLHYVLIC